MYETEANIKTEFSNQIPPEVLSGFSELREKIVARTVLPWSEHCTECVWPTCYSTCDFYSPREDGKCRRFVDGMVRLNCPTAVNSYLLKIRFKRWAKLWTPGNIHLHSLKKAKAIENRDYRVGTFLYQLTLPAPLKKTLVGKRYGFKKRIAGRVRSNGQVPSSFLVECFNPTNGTVPLSLTIRSSRNGEKIPFQKLVHLRPGFQVIRIPFGEIASVINLNFPFRVELIPNEVEEELTLYFGLMEFVQEVRPTADKGRTVKCVVWDLDNTLWNGILVEDGPTQLQLKSDVLSVIETLDRRGILQSIASKNNEEETMQVLKNLGISDFFLYPQISWGPKSEGIRAIARQLNIGIDSLLFVDDSEFELQEVKAACPGVVILNAQNYRSLPEMDACQVPVTNESINRRKMYQVERTREDVARSFSGDYKQFLKHCNIRLYIGPLTQDNIERVHELTQRTNQMNFSGNRYSREILGTLLDNPVLDTYVIECEDRFGSYGIIGFGIVDRREPRLTDLMFSCRIQSKRVEHAFLGYVISKYIEATGKDFYADYRKSPRNAASGGVFVDLGMEEVGLRDGVTSLLFSRDKVVPNDGLIELAVHVNTASAD